MEGFEESGKEASALFCVKMRASLHGAHISGAERIVRAEDVPAATAALSARALAHPKGRPDDIRVRVEPVFDPLVVPALPVRSESVATAGQGLALMAELLARDGVRRVPEIMALFRETADMRGAMLLDADTLERLEPDRARGVRATRMDATPPHGSDDGKNHFAEAVVLASKVQAAPGIVAEICVSDDPDYVTGYVASRTLGYRRISRLKEPGDPFGGRIFLFRGDRSLVPECIRFLQERPVLVSGVPARPPVF